MKNWEKRYSSADDNNHEIPLSFNFDHNQATYHANKWHGIADKHLNIAETHKDFGNEDLASLHYKYAGNAQRLANHYESLAHSLRNLNKSTKVPHNDGKNKTRSCLNCGKDTGDPIVNICSEKCHDEFING